LITLVLLENTTFAPTWSICQCPEIFEASAVADAN
jgi:hypothetical protein